MLPQNQPSTQAGTTLVDASIRCDANQTPAAAPAHNHSRRSAPAPAWAACRAWAAQRAARAAEAASSSSVPACPAAPSGMEKKGSEHAVSHSKQTLQTWQQPGRRCGAAALRLPSLERPTHRPVLIIIVIVAAAGARAPLGRCQPCRGRPLHRMGSTVGQDMSGQGGRYTASLGPLGRQTHWPPAHAPLPCIQHASAHAFAHASGGTLHHSAPSSGSHLRLHQGRQRRARRLLHNIIHVTAFMVRQPADLAPLRPRQRLEPRAVGLLRNEGAGVGRRAGWVSMHGREGEQAEVQAQDGVWSSNPTGHLPSQALCTLRLHYPPHHPLSS